MDVNPLHHGTTPGGGPNGVGKLRRVEPDGQRAGGGEAALDDEAAHPRGSTPGEAQSEDATPAPDAQAEDLLQAHDPVWDALVDEDGNREATTEHVPANRGAAAYRQASNDG